MDVENPDDPASSAGQHTEGGDASDGLRGPAESQSHAVIEVGASSNPPQAPQGDNSAHGLNGDVAAMFSVVKSVALQVQRNESKLDEIIKILQNGSLVGAKAGQKDMAKTSEAAELLMRSGRSIAALQAATNHVLTSAPDVGLLSCSVCVTASPTADQIGTAGVFKYDFGQGSNFADTQSLPLSFRHLRNAVKDHFCGPRHEKAALAKREADELTKGRFARNNSAASHVLRTGYFVLKRSLPRASFEDLIVLQSENGTRVGNMNHSSMFVPKMCLQFSAVMSDMLQKFIEQQPCVSLCADKVTVAKRTVDITAVVAVVAEAPLEQMIQSFVIAAPVVKNHSGDGLAEELCRSLTKVGVTHSDKLAAVCMDGQYHHNRVPEKLFKRLNATDPRFDTAPSVVVLWDGAHLLNLAEDDARRADGCAWVGKAISQVTAITKRYTVGKGLERLLSAGEDRGEPVMRPKLWSGTRFAPYAAKTLEVFLRNLNVMKEALEQQIQAGDTDGSEQRDLRLLQGQFCQCYLQGFFSKHSLEQRLKFFFGVSLTLL